MIKVPLFLLGLSHLWLLRWPSFLDARSRPSHRRILDCLSNSTKLRLAGLADHRPLVAAVESYIPGWCGKLLSPSGRTVLANAVLGARAVYATCSTLLHKGTIEAIDARRRAFIWTGDITCSGGGNARLLGSLSVGIVLVVGWALSV